MKREDVTGMTGAEILRLAVSNIDRCRESFLDEFTAGQLLKLCRALWLSDWDIYPDQWTKRQIRDALAGISPSFNGSERATYPTFRVKVDLNEKRAGSGWSQWCLDHIPRTFPGIKITGQDIVETWIVRAHNQEAAAIRVEDVIRKSGPAGAGAKVLK
jgi:hypothetical protein